MKNYNEIEEMVERIEIDTLLGLLHGVLLPILAMFLFQSRMGMMYLLIPFAIYQTVGRNRGSKEIFYSSAMITASITVASWVDAHD